MLRSQLITAMLLLLLPGALPLQAQTEAEAPISGGWMMGLHVSNRGVGASLDYLRGRNQLQWLAGVDLHSMRDPRETKIESIYGSQGRNYVFGKLNNFFILVPGVGAQWDMFPHHGGNMVNVRLGGKVGPAIGLLNPYFLEIYSPIPGRPRVGEPVVMPYDPAEHSYTDIIGRASWLSSSLDLQTQFGLSAQGHALLDFSNRDQAIKGLMVILRADWFAAPVPIMANTEELAPRQLFLSGSLGFMIGSRW